MTEIGKGREKKISPTHWLNPQMAAMVRKKPRVRKYTQVSNVETWTTNRCILRHISGKLDWKQRRWASN